MLELIPLSGISFDFFFFFKFYFLNESAYST